MSRHLLVDFMDISDDGTLLISEASFLKSSGGSGLTPNTFEIITLISPENSILSSMITSINDGVITIQSFPETIRTSFASDAHALGGNGYLWMNFVSEEINVVDSFVVEGEVSSASEPTRFVNT